MGNKTKNNPAQLQLWQDFENAKDGLQAALETLSKTVQALVAESALKPAQAVKEVRQVTRKADKELRSRLMKVVRSQARAKGLHWREIFRIAYDRLWNMTHVNLSARAIAAGGKTRKIDIAEKLGLLPKVLAIAAEM